jgi:hypothetical protein
MRRAGAVAALCCAVFTITGAPAQAGPNVPYCSNVQKLFGCVPPAGPKEPPAVDPGGSEAGPVAVPPAGRTFGFSAGLSKVGEFTPAQEALTVASAGASSHRIGISWKWMQFSETDPPLPASYDGDDGQNLRLIDERYAALLAAGVRPIIHVIAAPLWASRFASCDGRDMACQQEARKAAGWDQGGYYFPDSAHLPAYKAFNKALARRYPQADFEGWNEPNAYYNSPSDRAGEPWAPGPEEFRRIQCEAYWGVKEIDRNRRVISPAFLFRNWSHFSDYVNRVFAAGGPACWDGFATHIYFDGETEFGAGSWLAQNLAAVRRMKSYWGDRDPIWITETGWPTSGEDWWDRAISPDTQADAAGRLYNRLLTMPDVGGVFFHTLRDRLGGASADPHDNYGFLFADLSPKPAFCAFVLRSAHAYPGC